jgi:hypothetical protein
MVNRADIVDAAIRLLGEDELALYLGVQAERLSAYRAGMEEVPTLVTLRLVDRLLVESAHPSATLDAMSQVLQELRGHDEAETRAR